MPISSAYSTIYEHLAFPQARLGSMLCLVPKRLKLQLTALWSLFLDSFVSGLLQSLDMFAAAAQTLLYQTLGAGGLGDFIKGCYNYEGIIGFRDCKLPGLPAVHRRVKLLSLSWHSLQDFGLDSYLIRALCRQTTVLHSHTGTTTTTGLNASSCDDLPCSTDNLSREVF